MFSVRRLLTNIKSEQTSTLKLSGLVIKNKEREVKNNGNLRGHGSFVNAFTSLLNGWLASGATDNTIKLWEMKKGVCKATLRGHSAAILVLRVLPDGRLVSGSTDNTIKVWDVERGICLATLYGHNHAVTALAVLPDGRLISGSWDNTVRLWDVNRGICQAILLDRDRVNTLAVLSDELLAIGSHDNSTIKLWNLKNNAWWVLAGHSRTINTLAVLLNGLLASGSDDGMIKFWDVKKGSCRATLHGHSGAVNALAVLPDGRLASISGGWNGTVQLWKVRGGIICQATLRISNNVAHTLAVLVDGRLASGAWDGSIRLWDCGLRLAPWSAMQRVLRKLKNYPYVHKVDLRNTALNDAAISKLAEIFQSNRTVTELMFSNTRVTPKGADMLYKLLPFDHPLRQGLHHKAMLSIYCKEVLGNLFSDPLIDLMMEYVSPKDAQCFRKLVQPSDAKLLAKERAKLFNQQERKMVSKSLEAGCQPKKLRYN